MKVYGWHGFRKEEGNFHKQTREIVAAKSKVEAARVAGYKRPTQMFNLCETGNQFELDTALAKPGVVFWRCINDYSDNPYNEGSHDRRR